ncbi:MAG: hypothetical protein RBR71_11240 [Gudongella sp.]|nr:hypothetical protein [Gudongella sp.]
MGRKSKVSGLIKIEFIEKHLGVEYLIRGIAEEIDNYFVSMVQFYRYIII